MEDLLDLRVIVIDPPMPYREFEYVLLKALLGIFKERGVLGGKALRRLGLTGERPVAERAANKWDKNRLNRDALAALRQTIKVEVCGAPVGEVMTTVEVREHRLVEKDSLLTMRNGQFTNFLHRICAVVAETLRVHPDRIDFQVYPAQSEPKSVERKKFRPSSGHRTSRYRHPFPNHRSNGADVARRRR